MLARVHESQYAGNLSQYEKRSGWKMLGKKGNLKRLLGYVKRLLGYAKSQEFRLVGL